MVTREVVRSLPETVSVEVMLSRAPPAPPVTVSVAPVVSVTPGRLAALIKAARVVTSVVALFVVVIVKVTSSMTAVSVCPALPDGVMIAAVAVLVDEEPARKLSAVPATTELKVTALAVDWALPRLDAPRVL